MSQLLGENLGAALQMAAVQGYALATPETGRGTASKIILAAGEILTISSLLALSITLSMTEELPTPPF